MGSGEGSGKSTGAKDHRSSSFGIAGIIHTNTCVIQESMFVIRVNCKYNFSEWVNIMLLQSTWWNLSLYFSSILSLLQIFSCLVSFTIVSFGIFMPKKFYPSWEWVPFSMEAKILGGFYLRRSKILRIL